MVITPGLPQLGKSCPMLRLTLIMARPSPAEHQPIRFLGITDLTTTLYTNTTPLLTKQVNFQPTSYVTIRSPNLGTFMTLDSNGGRTIIKKVPVSSERGQNIIDNSHSNDPLDCSRMTLRNMEFIITDESGNELDLGGQNISFTIIFLLGPKQ